MPLKTLVKVGNISNLSDARYCSGMGVDMLGFCVIEGKANYISPKLFQEIRGWIPGPRVVAEIYGLQSAEQLQEIIRNYAPDHFEMNAEEYERYQSVITHTCLVDISGTTRLPAKINPAPAYFIVDDAEQVTDTGIPSLLRITSGENLAGQLHSPLIHGVVLNGSPEIRPGFKDYDHLAEILEQLDE